MLNVECKRKFFRFLEAYFFVFQKCFFRRGILKTWAQCVREVQCQREHEIPRVLRGDGVCEGLQGSVCVSAGCELIPLGEAMLSGAQFIYFYVGLYCIV